MPDLGPIVVRTGTATLFRSSERWPFAKVLDRDGVAVATIHFSYNDIVVRLNLRETVIANLPGRPLSDVLDMSGLITCPHTKITACRRESIEGTTTLKIGSRGVDGPTFRSKGTVRFSVQDLLKVVSA